MRQACGKLRSRPKEGCRAALEVPDIFCMYAKGMTTNDISGHIEEIYRLSVSDSTVSRVTAKMMDITKKQTDRRKDWGEIHFQLEMFFGECIPN